VTCIQFQNQVNKFHKALRTWGEDHIKFYPWRYLNDTYAILVSEMMLHRTNKSQVEKVFNEFMKEYPTLVTFISADHDEVKKILNPLGLNWRIDGIIETLNSLWMEYQEVPSDKSKLIREKNVGDYIAGATETFAEDTPNALVDTNTVRVIGRMFGLNLEGEARRRKETIDTICSVCDAASPRDYYYTLIDFAHEVCTAKNPKCIECPLGDVPCDYYMKELVGGV